jgi:hypothetical protein
MPQLFQVFHPLQVPLGAFFCSTIVSGFLSLFSPPPPASNCYNEKYQSVPAINCRTPGRFDDEPISVTVDTAKMRPCYEDVVANLVPKSWTPAQLALYKAFLQQYPGFSFPSCNRPSTWQTVKCDGRSTASKCTNDQYAQYANYREQSVGSSLGNFAPLLNGPQYTTCKCLKGEGPGKTCQNCRGSSCNGFTLTQCYKLYGYGQMPPRFV